MYGYYHDANFIRMFFFPFLFFLHKYKFSPNSLQCNTECVETRNVSCVKKNKDSTESSTSCDLNVKPSSKRNCSQEKCNFGKNTGIFVLHLSKCISSKHC